MARLPALPVREVVRAFDRAGYKFVRQKGSRLILYNAARGRILSIPNHDPVKRGTLRSHWPGRSDARPIPRSAALNARRPALMQPLALSLVPA